MVRRLEEARRRAVRVTEGRAARAPRDGAGDRPILVGVIEVAAVALRQQDQPVVRVTHLPRELGVGRGPEAFQRWLRTAEATYQGRLR